MSIQFDPQSPEFRANPYPYYDALRTTAPVFYWEAREMWLLTGYEDCKKLLVDQRLGNTPSPGSSMLFQNPPDHTRLRSLVSKAFTPRMVAQFQTRIQTIADTLIDQVKDTGHMDIIADMAYPIPVTVIAEMLGVPPEDHVTFQGWSRIIVKGLDFGDQSETDPARSQAIEAFNDYFRVLIDERRSSPKDDLLSALVAAEEVGDKLTEQELYTTCRLLLIAGHETTVNLIGNGMLALLNHPAQRQWLQENPDRIATAVEELLRYDSPIQLIGRTVLEDFEYKGQILQQGQSLTYIVGAANRDAAQFENPHALDLTREKNQHLSFGNGIHYCLGAPLARLEGQIAINTLLQRLPNLTLATDSITYTDNYVFRGVEALPVTF